MWVYYWPLSPYEFTVHFQVLPGNDSFTVCPHINQLVFLLSVDFGSDFDVRKDTYKVWETSRTAANRIHLHYYYNNLIAL